MTNKIAIVTGAGQGMGRSVAMKLASEGTKIIVNDVNAEQANSTVSKINALGGKAYSNNADVTSRDEVTNMVDQCLTQYGNVHILVNNAGVLRPTKVIDIEEQEWDWVIGVNLKGTYLCSRAVLPAMQDAGWGRIVNFSSTAGKSTSTVGGAHYTAAKAGILGFTRHLSRESASFGITVNSVCPGLINTEMVRSTISEDRVKFYTDSFPISRMGDPIEVAELVAFLASDKAAYITGASLDINGGDLTI
jgi:NAD(P)-dependent dehydrogenase (short-subunit alcohol dehydrogenase family)